MLDWVGCALLLLEGFESDAMAIDFFLASPGLLSIDKNLLNSSSSSSSAPVVFLRVLSTALIAVFAYLPFFLSLFSSSLLVKSKSKLLSAFSCFTFTRGCFSYYFLLLDFLLIFSFWTIFGSYFVTLWAVSCFFSYFIGWTYSIIESSLKSLIDNLC